MFCLLFHSTSVLGVWIMFYFIVGKQAWVCCWFHVWAVFLVETLNCYKSTKESLEPSWFRWAKDVTFDLLQEKALDPTPLKSLISNKKVHDCQSNTYYRLGEGLPLQAFFPPPRNAVDRIQIKTWYLRKTLQQNVCPAVFELAPGWWVRSTFVIPSLLSRN